MFALIIMIIIIIISLTREEDDTFKLNMFALFNNNPPTPAHRQAFLQIPFDLRISHEFGRQTNHTDISTWAPAKPCQGKGASLRRRGVLCFGLRP